MQTNGGAIPGPLSEKHYSGEFRMRPTHEAAVAVDSEKTTAITDSLK